jgi:uncharacterized coiled-coil protein SlyX
MKRENRGVIPLTALSGALGYIGLTMLLMVCYNYPNYIKGDIGMDNLADIIQAYAPLLTTGGVIVAAIITAIVTNGKAVGNVRKDLSDDFNKLQGKTNIVLNRFGRFEGISADAAIGVERGKASLSAQHNELKAASNEILKKASYLVDAEREKTARIAAIGTFKVQETTDSIMAMANTIAEQSKLISNLQSELAVLNQTLAEREMQINTLQSEKQLDVPPSAPPRKSTDHDHDR